MAHRSQDIVDSRCPLYTHETVNTDSYNTSGSTVLNYVNGSATFNNFSPRLSLLYLASDQVNLYATISRGFKAGGVEAQPLAVETMSTSPRH